LAGELDVNEFNPVDSTAMAHLDEYYSIMRAESPVHFVAATQMYLVTRHEDVLQVLRDPATFSSAVQPGQAVLPVSDEDATRIEAIRAQRRPIVPVLGATDPPEHTRYRRLVGAAFSVRSIKALEPMIRTVATELIDSWITRDTIDFVREFAVPYPTTAIAKALNVPDDRLADFKRWSDGAILNMGSNPTIDERVEAERGLNEFQQFFVDVVEARRADPQPDFVGMLLNASLDDDASEVKTRPLDLTEILSILMQLVVGGNETTAKMLADAMRWLGERPDLWRRIQADSSYIPSVVEESLRMSSVAQAMRRFATCETELGGVVIPKGSRVFVVYRSANRDDRVFAEPDTFNPDRENVGTHLAFGKGIHYCIGANLARLEAQVALEELSRRLDTVAVSASNDFAMNDSFVFRGLRRLDLDLVPARPAIG
jgi:cytochrome P450